MNVNALYFDLLTKAAAENPGVNLGELMKKMSSGIGFLGGVLLVFGLINLGLSLKDGAQGGGGQLAGAISMIVGGGIVIAASVYFAGMDTSWAN